MWEAQQGRWISCFESLRDSQRLSHEALRRIYVEAMAHWTHLDDSNGR